MECENLNEALEWANKVPLGSGSIEIRPVMEAKLSASRNDSQRTIPLREGECSEAAERVAGAE
jgi:hypothetical protein